jgi:hypothetical protein
MQPNGQPIMIMPMIAGSRPMPEQVQLNTYYNQAQQPQMPLAIAEPIAEPIAAPVPAPIPAPAPAPAPAPVEETQAEEPQEIEVQPQPVVEDVTTGESVGLTEEEAVSAAVHKKRVQKLTDKWVNMGLQARAEKEVGATQPENFASENPYMAKIQAKARPTQANDVVAAPATEPAPAKMHKVSCPGCGQRIAASENAYAHRCPHCGTLFRLKKN